MKIVEIVALENGGHRNQNCHITVIPNGYAMIPDDMVCENFPFGTLTAEEINGIMTVTSWTPGAIPELKNSKETLTQLDRIEAQVTYTAMMTDTLLEA